MFFRRVAVCCRRVLVVVLVSVLLVSACSPASEEEEGGRGSLGAGTEVPGSSASSPSSQRALEVLEEVFTGEELGDLQEVFTEEELVDLAGQFSGEELVGLLGLGSVADSGVLEFADVFEGFWDGFSDGEVRALAFLDRSILDSVYLVV